MEEQQQLATPRGGVGTKGAPPPVTGSHSFDKPGSGGSGGTLGGTGGGSSARSSNSASSGGGGIASSARSAEGDGPVPGLAELLRVVGEGGADWKPATRAAGLLRKCAYMSEASATAIVAAGARCMHATASDACFSASSMCQRLLTYVLILMTNSVSPCPQAAWTCLCPACPARPAPAWWSRPPACWARCATTTAFRHA